MVDFQKSLSPIRIVCALGAKLEGAKCLLFFKMVARQARSYLYDRYARAYQFF